jgi:hypothetical protein
MLKKGVTPNQNYRSTQVLSDGQPLSFIVRRSVVLIISDLAFNSSTSQLAHTNLPVRKSDSELANQTQKAPGRPIIEDRLSACCHNTVRQRRTGLIEYPCQP